MTTIRIRDNAFIYADDRAKPEYWYVWFAEPDDEPPSDELSGWQELGICVIMVGLLLATVLLILRL